MTHTPAPPPMPSARAITERFESALTRGLGRVTTSVLGPYQTAVVRIGFSLTWLLFLLREFPHRRELYGPDGPWSFELGERLVADNGAFTVLLWSSGIAWFELVYALAMLSSVLLLLGWRTRTSSVLFMIGVLSLQNRSIFMGDGGDNVIHLMATYLVLTRCAQVWSLDSRRRARQASVVRHADNHAHADTDADADRYVDAVDAAGADAYDDEDAYGDEDVHDDAAGTGTGYAADAPPRDPVGVWLWSVLGFLLLSVTLFGLLTWGWAVVFWGLWIAHALWWAVQRLASDEPRSVCDVLANLAHNTGLLVIMAEVCLIYATAGWYKVSGSRWQDGTAVYYPLNLDYFTPWNGLADVLSASGTMIMLLSYGTVIVQVAFPFTLFNRRLKNVLLTIMIIDHASIAVIMGLPFFSLAMISADLVFLPTVFLMWLGAGAGALRHRVPRWGRSGGFGGRDGRDGQKGRDRSGGGQAAASGEPVGHRPLPGPATSPEYREGVRST